MIWLSFFIMIIITGAREYQNMAFRQTNRIETITLQEVVQAIAQDKVLFFVDAREPEEFLEARIPGAVNLPLSAITPANIAAFKQADYVIPYCMKDFRGFEVARVLQQHGVKNVYLLRQHGFNGWKANQLPVAGALSGVQDAVGWQHIKRCWQQNCLPATRVNDAAT